METTTATPILAMEVGTYVRSKTVSTASYSNKIGVIADKTRPEDGRIWVKFLNQEYDSGLREFMLSPSDVEVLTDQENAPNMQLLEAWESRYHNQRQIIQRRDAGEEALQNTVITVLDELGYCDEGDRAIEKINESLASQGHSIRLRMREREYEIRVNIRTTVWASTLVRVTAASEEEAIEMVEDDPDCYLDSAEVVCDEVNDGSCDFEYECEVV
jgi:hypothetical protein